MKLPINPNFRDGRNLSASIIIIAVLGILAVLEVDFRDIVIVFLCMALVKSAMNAQDALDLGDYNLVMFKEHLRLEHLGKKEQ